ncbi:B-cell CLL/lymphoma 9-like protein isoform X2 [Xenopus laevis]|uniref:B-cell CLL/lymphoma 9-like protein isoform X2 n=1 Tax=Xenopus laevis TaxID=8355 RepID=A0A8J0TB42_XENLA|nr:B-cell CLL/lymphoma 9-like protein isoform X2 [Xenopus laevis]
MHPESKLANHGNVSSSGGKSQTPNVNQGTKGAGLLSPKANHTSPSGVGLISGQSQGSNLAKGQRESAGDVDEQGETGPPPLEQDPKELPSRRKRRCVLERKQPYSGDEWCSGADSEEDEKTLVVTHNCNAGESVMSTPTLPGTGSASLPGINDTSSSSTPHGVVPSLRGDGGGSLGPSKTPSKFVYVFTTFLANKAAEAVLQGHNDSILIYHKQNVPHRKLDEVSPQKPSSAQEAGEVLPVPSIPTSAVQKPAENHSPAPSQAPPTIVSQEIGSDEANHELTPLGNGSSHPASGRSNPPPLLSQLPSAPLRGDNTHLGDHNQGDSVTLSTDGLSKEQLEHRERSLQTLRDIERFLFRSGAANESFSKHNLSSSEGPTNTPSHIKKYEEPLQSMITQTQSLGGPGMEQDLAGNQNGPDMGHQMSLMMQRMGHDSLTPEQAAWRKLQEEYYVEKRRKEEHVSIHGRSGPEMILRGPPPPYHSKPGEQWPGNRLQVPMDIQESMQLRSGIPFQGPRFPGRYGPMQNIPMDSVGVMSRPARWSEDMPPIDGGQSNFAQIRMPYSGGIQGEMERFLNPRAREELLRQQLMIEKRPGVMQRQLSMPCGQGIEMMITHRQGDPSMFPGESMGAGSAVGMEFGASRGMLSPTLGQSGTGREIDPTMGGGGNLNMNMSLNMNMNLNLQMAPQQQMLLSHKIRGVGDLNSQGDVGSEDLVRAARAQNGSGMVRGPQKMLPGQFPQGQAGFPPGQGSYPGMQQEISMDIFGPEQGPVVGTTRLSHMPVSSTPGTMPSGIGLDHIATSRNLTRRELTVNANQMESPVLSHIKSPHQGQVHSPLICSPSSNLKSPLTPGNQMGGLPLPNPLDSLKSSQVLISSIGARSPNASPGRLKSPQRNAPSPGWAPSPKATISSPGVPPSNQGMGLNATASLGVMGRDELPSQNPLSLMMSQMSKYAMPSSTPLYHNAIKTIATSDDELLPDRVLLPPGSQQGSSMNPPMSLHLNLNSSQSPIGNINVPGQSTLSHEPPSSLLTGSGPPMHPSIGSTMQNPLLISSVTQDSCCPGPGTQIMSSNQLVFPSRLQPGHQGGVGSSMQQHYTDDTTSQPCLPHRMSDPYGRLLPSMLTDPELGDVIRPSATGIPEFDLSRIMPSEKPSSTLQYFPKGGTQTPKPHPTNMHLLGLQNMMIEQHPGRSGPSLPGPQRSLGMPPLPTMGRTGMFPPPQMVQQNFMMMKQRSVSGEMYPQGAPMLSPQGPLGGHLPGQQSMLVGHQMRPRSVSLDTYITGPGHLQF